MFPTNEITWRESYLDVLPTTSGLNYFWSLPKLVEDFNFRLSEQPFIVRIFLENIMRHYSENSEAEDNLTSAYIKSLTAGRCSKSLEFPFRPRRILMQDYTGVPAITDLAAMRDAVSMMGGDANKVNPLCPVELVIDHSVTVAKAGCSDALEHNRHQEMIRNREHYQLLKWAEQSFDNLTVIPTGLGICHQINLEYIAQAAQYVA